MTDDPVRLVSEREISLESDLAELLNRYSAENGSDTPDFILANYLRQCLAAFDWAVRRREEWFGRTPTERRFREEILPERRASLEAALSEATGLDIRMESVATCALCGYSDDYDHHVNRNAKSHHPFMESP